MDKASSDNDNEPERNALTARVLTYILQAIPFSSRVDLFNSLIKSNKVWSQDKAETICQMMWLF